MFNPTTAKIDAFCHELRRGYVQNYGILDPDVADIMAWAGRMALETIATSDAPYHDVDHTICVTMVGLELLRGKHLREGGIAPNDWLSFCVALLCHDIGYVRGICQADRVGRYATGVGDKMVELPRGATDASLTPYHVDRGKLFIKERFGGHSRIDAEQVTKNIELTRFPVPDDEDHQDTTDLPGLLRAADLIGQLADPRRSQKIPGLFHEFEETGMNEKFGYRSPADLAETYPTFFWGVVHPYVRVALRHLDATQEGKVWIAQLYAQVFASEHRDLLG